MQQGQAMQALQERQQAIYTQKPVGGGPAVLLQMPAMLAFERGWQQVNLSPTKAETGEPS
eukprot:9499901-Pyramimonas_sp.AAC.1